MEMRTIYQRGQQNTGESNQGQDWQRDTGDKIKGQQKKTKKTETGCKAFVPSPEMTGALAAQLTYAKIGSAPMTMISCSAEIFALCGEISPHLAKNVKLQ